MKERTYVGSVPSEANGWDILAEVIDADSGAAFALCEKEQEHSDEWVTIKVAAKGRVANKANYWFAFNTRTNQIGFSRDLALMRANRPKLHARIEEILGIR